MTKTALVLTTDSSWCREPAAHRFLCDALTQLNSCWCQETQRVYVKFYHLLCPIMSPAQRLINYKKILYQEDC